MADLVIAIATVGHSYTYQLTHLSAQRGSLKHDDRLDVLAAAVKHWQEFLNRDAHKAEEEWKRKQDAAWEKEFFKGTFVGQNLERPKAMTRGTGRARAGSRRSTRW